MAINKADVVGSNIEEIEEQLIDEGVDLEPYGGHIPVIPISAKTGKNVDLLIELLNEESQRLNLKADLNNGVEA